MRFEAEGVDQETTDIINRNIQIIEEWLHGNVSAKERIVHYMETVNRQFEQEFGRNIHQAQRPRRVRDPYLVQGTKASGMIGVVPY